MRSIIRSTSQLSELRSSLRRDVSVLGDSDTIVGDFVAAVNEIVAAAVSHDVPRSDAARGIAVDVRWRRRAHPHTELYAEVRNTAGTPRSLIDEGISSRLLAHYAERVEFDERIGGSVITVRCRV